MKAINQYLAPALLAALTLALGVKLSVADQSSDPKNQPSRFNKATGIVGMEVTSPGGERLGAIKDVVFDLKSERVAYAVLGTTSQKLLAVPLGALTPGADSDHLILHADRASLESARGFTADNWPAPVSLVWAAQPGARPTPQISLPHR
jgi:PRC-barrel domain